MLQSFKMALKSIWGNKMRSFLTMLGIIIGVASVIILVSIVNGYMSYMTESFASMGVNQITVNYRSLPSRTIDVEEFYEFYEENQDLFQGMTPSVSVSATVKHGSDTMDATTVGGYSEDQLSIKGYELSCGRNLLYSDMASRQKVAVVGAYVASELFGSPEKALGERSSSTGIIIQWWALWSSRRKALRTLTTAVPTISCGSPIPGRPRSPGTPS